VWNIVATENAICAKCSCYATRSGRTTIDCTLEESLREETDGEVFRVDRVIQNDAVHMEEEAL